MIDNFLIIKIRNICIFHGWKERITLQIWTLTFYFQSTGQFNQKTTLSPIPFIKEFHAEGSLTRVLVIAELADVFGCVHLRSLVEYILQGACEGKYLSVNSPFPNFYFLSLTSFLSCSKTVNSFLKDSNADFSKGWHLELFIS